MQGLPSFRLWQVARIDLDCCPKLLVARITMFTLSRKMTTLQKSMQRLVMGHYIMSQLGGSLVAQGPIRFNENIRGVSNLKIWDNLLFKPKACGWNHLKNPLPKLGDYLINLTSDLWFWLLKNIAWEMYWTCAPPESSNIVDHSSYLPSTIGWTPESRYKPCTGKLCWP